MSVHRRGDAHVVYWRDATGGQRSKSFETYEDAAEFDSTIKLRKAAAKLRRAKGAKLYAIRAGDKVKIGFAFDPEKRLRALQAGSPVPLTLEWVITHPDPFKLEQELHEGYREHRSHGEWFDAEPVLADIEDAAREFGQFMERRES